MFNQHPCSLYNCFSIIIWNSFSTHVIVLKAVFFSLAAKLREACFDPGNVMNGSRMGTDYKLGSMVTFHCEAGYLLQGYSTLTCVMGNSKRPEWDRAKPSCQGERQRCSTLADIMSSRELRAIRMVNIWLLPFQDFIRESSLWHVGNPASWGLNKNKQKGVKMETQWRLNYNQNYICILKHDKTLKKLTLVRLQVYSVCLWNPWKVI